MNGNRLKSVLMAAMLLVNGVAMGQVTVNGSVFGGGNLATVGGNVTVNMSAGTVTGDVYGGGAFADTNINNVTGYDTDSEAISSTTANTTTVNLTGGTIGGNAYGGGLGQLAKEGTAAVYYSQEEADAYNSEHGLTEGQDGFVTTTTIKTQAVAGVEEKVPLVYGDVMVVLNGTKSGDVYSSIAETAKGCIVGGNIFGCNNVNGTPKGNVEVHVYATQSAATENIKTNVRNTSAETVTGAYDVKAVYGGGNEAAYVPMTPNTSTTTTTNGARTQVIIEGCELTSIETVYGGGNAASVPESNVEILGAYEIGYVYGGGNGKDNLSDGSANPGADVGQYKNSNGDLVTYGTGIPNTLLQAGLIHEAYGGSNMKGVIKGSINLTTNPLSDGDAGYCCALRVDKVVGAGKYADIEGDVILVMGCMPEAKTAELYGGADEANVKGNVELTITSGSFGKVFGGNNLGGAILGHIIVNIEETGCRPIEIDELYLGGNEAAYSIYGYYDSGETNAVGKPVYLPRTAAMHAITDTSDENYKAPVANPTSDATHSFPYADPVLNVISATRIGKVFGGGLGSDAMIHGNPTVNINMIKGTATGSSSELGTIGDVYGGGNEAVVEGSTTVNIGTETTVQLHESYNKSTSSYTMSEDQTVLGANITGSVFGGGNEADVTGDTHVNICAEYDKDEEVYKAVAEGTAKVKIGGSVFGGGKGKDDTFECEKAMVGIVDQGIGSTNVVIGNGTVTGSVYGGGQIGRVEHDTKVMIGLASGESSAPEIKEDVFGAGKGLRTHGYAALVRGDAKVIVQGNAKVRNNVYGGGEIASVGRFNVAKDEAEAAAHGVAVGMPYELVSGGNSSVTIQGNAEIGPSSAMQMKKEDGPDDAGHVFGAGKGILPLVYAYTDDENKPSRMIREGDNHSKWEYFAGETAYIAFIETLALTNDTEVKIDGNALVKGSVYGGSENGHVREDTHVTIAGGQIGCGKNATGGRHDASVWGEDYIVPEGTDLECDSWDYLGDHEPYDIYKDSDGNGTPDYATDGHTFYGNVFGGGRGYYPYRKNPNWTPKEAGSSVDVNGYSDGLWLSSAGAVYRNTVVDITGGHILTSVYGGNELTNVTGSCTINMTGGTVGVPRTLDQMQGHPVTCSLYGAGKGDQRINFNTWTNVASTQVNISGNARIYGSTFGGGEDGHVLGNVESNIGGTITIGSTEYPYSKVIIGTTGTSGVDGNVFGGGRGFSETALTAGVVGGNVSVNIHNGTMLGTVFGGGRLASVGTNFADATNTEKYGKMQVDEGTDTHGHINITIDGGTIGATTESGALTSSNFTIGDVYGGGKGSPNNDLRFGLTKTTTITMSGGHVNGSVYGGGEVAVVEGNATITINGGEVGDCVTKKGGDKIGNVYGSGKGNLSEAGAGLVKGNTSVTIEKGESTTPTIYHNVYGGGSYGSVGDFTLRDDGSPGSCTSGGTAEITITGGTIGTDGDENGMVFGSSRGDVQMAKDGQDPNNKLAWVNTANVIIGIQGSETGPQINGSIYGSGENGHVLGNANVAIHSGTIGIASGTAVNGLSGVAFPNRGNVYGGGCGTDYFTVDGKNYFNKTSGIVRGNTTVTMDGGHVVRNIYGGGAMGSVGGYSRTTKGDDDPYKDNDYVPAVLADNATGICTVTISGGQVGVDGNGNGMVFAAGRGQVVDPAEYPNYDRVIFTNNTELTISGTATIKGSVYGGSESGHVWGDTKVTIAGGTVDNSVFGGGEVGYVRGAVKVSVTDGQITHDVYGGGALASTQTGNWDETNKTWATGKTSASKTTIVNLTGGTIGGDAYGGGLGQKEYGTADQTGYVSPVEAMVYGDVKVELNNIKKVNGDMDEDAKGCAVSRVFGCNNLNGTPKGKVQVYVYATQKIGGENIADKADKNTNAYDVAAVYGGGNLAKYEPVDALFTYNDANKATVDAARPEVYIDGCGLTSIKQVYGGGNAAPVPATYVEINRVYEIDEAFGGGNGYDDYSLQEGGSTVWYQNPGANVGYYTYADYPKTSGQGSGTQADPYEAVQWEDYNDEGGANKDKRLAATDIQFGSGIATLVVKGGTVHTSYGGSNSKGNVRAKLSSTYSAMYDDCPMEVTTSYGGGKNAYSDADAEVSADCAKGVTEMFGGAKDADFNGNISLTITNGSSLERVFGGNNTSGAVNGSITVTIKEGGCEPIRIGSLYAGGYLADYSVYGYNADKTVKESGTRLYADPRINVISATYIGNIFGGGYQAKLVGNPHINVNMEPGRILAKFNPTVGDHEDYSHQAYKVESIEEGTGDGILPVGTIGNIYGGGNLADIVGNTYVEIGTGKWVKLDAEGNEVEETLTRNAAKITGNVFGGGKGEADEFTCAKAMVGVDGDGVDHPNGGTNVIIGNGTIGGNVYGGGEIGRVEKNTVVTIGLAADDVPEGLTSLPVIAGSVFGGGKGKETHGYAALVRGNPAVTIQGKAKVKGNVYGGGEIASVARYQVVNGVPVALAQVKEGQHSGYCTVIVKDNAEIGPDGMKMYHPEITDGTDKPDDWGHVFGAGKGILPENYTYADNENRPKRMMAYDSEKYNASNSDYWAYSDTEGQNVWEYFPNRDKYIEFIQTQALATHTDVTIEGNAFVKGSVYGGSENGLVQYDTDVKIKGNCQIGEGEGANGRYTDWSSTSLAGCAHWEYDPSSGAPYDPYAKYLKDGKYYYDEGCTEYAEGGSYIAKDGHTYYGNVFGGGSGSVPYFDNTLGRSVYLNSAGTVKGNTKVTISGGHILTSVYGGCEATNVLGTATVTMTGGTIGVPRTEDEIQAHPVICNLFGAGKGDQRIFFNKDTNVENAEVSVSGTAKIYGSVFGGGEDGHVMKNSTVTIGDGANIGTLGYSGFDGNVFGGGRGFGGDALTAGNVGGDVEVNINGGTMLGSVYGGGRLASVGYGLYLVDEEVDNEKPYGVMREDGKDDNGNSVGGFTRGHVKVNVSGGIIGNDVESTDTHTKGGNVFGGSMGRLTLLNGDINPIWPKLAKVKSTEVKISGDAVIKNNVYGGGELGTVHTTSKVTVEGGTVNGDLFGGGYGSDDYTTKTTYGGVDYIPMQLAGRVDGTTTVEVKDGSSVKENVYGGGEMASVGTYTVSTDMRTFTWKDTDGNTNTDGNTKNTGVCNVTVTGGKIGTEGSSDKGHVFGAGKGLSNTFWCEAAIVYGTNVNISGGTVNGNVYGGGEVGRVETDTEVKVDGNAEVKGNVFGAGAGLETHGYSALVRGDTKVTVEGTAQVGHSVYGGGEIASVGKYGLDTNNEPSILLGGGICDVNVQGNAKIGENVFGAGKGVTPHFDKENTDHSLRSRRMTVYTNTIDFPAGKENETWEYYKPGSSFVWDYFVDEPTYSTYLETLALATHPDVTIDGSATVKGSVFGGGELGLTKGSVVVNIKGGTVEEDVYGGGSLANTNTTSTVGHTNADGTVETETVHPTTTVNLLGGTIRNAYGGGLGRMADATNNITAIEALVYGDVNVNLNGTTTITTAATGNKTYTPSPNDPTKKGCVVKGNVFGANNVNGTPKGHVLVYVHGTQNENTSAINAKVDDSYDVAKVFGGGNQADYVPTSDEEYAEVIIEGCDLTSIEEVYGGGYGAATPATNVLIKGTKIIDNVFGGGYGAGADNPGANIGYKTGTTEEYGTGKTSVRLMAGNVNNVYGGSNTLGNVRGGTSVRNVANTSDPGCCDKLDVGNVYGGGKEAVMEGGAEIVLGCMPNDWIEEIYAGSREANVGNDVSLTLTSGKFGRVFGGNMSSGTIDGSITVNIEENPECETPLVIGELYGGGNEAPYTIPDSFGADYPSPRVNVRSFTSIGNIYGGGYGRTATVTGNPTVNINEVIVDEGRADDYDVKATSETVPENLSWVKDIILPHKAGKMGVINNVFGGGNAAKVVGNTYVNIGTTTEEDFESERLPNGTVPKRPVVGADIRGNVYGGGNAADVSGKTNVVIGEKIDN